MSDHPDTLIVRMRIGAGRTKALSTRRLLLDAIERITSLTDAMKAIEERTYTRQPGDSGRISGQLNDIRTLATTAIVKAEGRA